MLGCVTGCEPGSRGCQVGLPNQLLWTGDLSTCLYRAHTHCTGDPSACELLRELVKSCIQRIHTCFLTSISGLHVSWPRTTVMESPLECNTHLLRML